MEKWLMMVSKTLGVHGNPLSDILNENLVGYTGIPQVILIMESVGYIGIP